MSYPVLAQQTIISFVPIGNRPEEVCMAFNRNIGLLLLGIWLILIGLAEFVSLGNIGTLTNVLALAAGILIVLGR